MERLASIAVLFAVVTGVIVFLGEVFFFPKFSFPTVHEGIQPGLWMNAHGYLGILLVILFLYELVRYRRGRSLLYLAIALLLLFTGWHSGDFWFFKLFGELKDSPQAKGFFLSLHLSLGVILFVFIIRGFSPKEVLSGIVLIAILGLIPFPHGVPRPYRLEKSWEPSRSFSGGTSSLSDWGCRVCHLSHEGKRGEDLHHLHRELSCVTCHRGSGGTIVGGVAHGRAGWSVREPILTGVWIQSTCTGCHLTIPSRGAELLEEGERLWKEGGCAGCHGDPEERLGPYLRRMVSAVGMDPLSPLGRELVALRGYPPYAAFFAEAIVDPKTHLSTSLSPGAMPVSMPVYSYFPRELTAITLKVLSLREWGYPPNLTVSVLPRSSMTGRELFLDPEKGCVACHRLLGEGGDLGPPLDPWVGRDPEVLSRILLDPHRAPLPGYPAVMPRDYDKRLTREELKLLVEYIVRGKDPP